MQEELIDKLKLACNQFYLGKDIDKGIIPDVEFDPLRKQYESETGRSVKELVDWENKLERVNLPEEPLNKIIAEDNNLPATAFNEYKSQIANNPSTTGYTTPKYDGCGIKAVYSNGRLQFIQSTPDEQYGIIRTKAFWNMFPHELDDKSIIALRGEVLVDADQYGQLARNKANGLTNSVYMEDEVENECFIRVYKVQYDNDNSLSIDQHYLRQLLTLSKLNPITRVRFRDGKEHTDVVFSAAKMSMIEPATILPNEPIWEDNGVKVQVDGMVLYTNNGTLGIKYYYTEYADTEVTGIQWNQKQNGSYAAVLNINEVELNGKYINNVSSGGVPHMMEWKMGKGAKVRVILANMTIPKVIDVLKESEDYEFPSCECGHQLSENDIFGATLKCSQNHMPCKGKYNLWLPDMAREILVDPNHKTMNFEQFFKLNWLWFLSYLFIDRWTPDGKLIANNEDDKQKVRDSLYNSIITNDIELFHKVIGDNFSFTDLSWSNFEINYKTTFRCIYSIYLHWNDFDSHYSKYLG